MVTAMPTITQRIRQQYHISPHPARDPASATRRTRLSSSFRSELHLCPTGRPLIELLVSRNDVHQRRVLGENADRIDGAAPDEIHEVRNVLAMVAVALVRLRIIAWPIGNVRA